MSSRPSPISDAYPSRAALLARLAASGPFGFGASALGNLYGEVDDDHANAAVDAAWESGVRFFDTAPFYGCGLSERRLGDALRRRPRDAYLLSTKAGRLLVPAGTARDQDGFRSPMPFRPVFDYSYDGVMRSFEASLHRLGLARIDVLLLHDLGGAAHGPHHPHFFDQAVSGGFRALTALRDQGAVSAIGLGVNEVEVCAASLERADFDLFLIAGRFTLLDQSAAEFYDTCASRGVGVLTAGVFSSGILAAGAAGPNAYHGYAPAPEAVRAQVAAMERICREHGAPLPAAALQFAASHPAVTLPVVGVRDRAEAEAAAAFRRLPIAPALWQALERAGMISARAPQGALV